MQFEIDSKDLKLLNEAVKRNPSIVKKEVGIFLTRSKGLYLSSIQNNPWRIGMSGGGAPVKSGNLRDTHRTFMSPWQMIIKPTAPYASFIHNGSRYMQSRPWLEYAMQTNDRQVGQLEEQMLDNIVKDLAS